MKRERQVLHKPAAAVRQREPEAGAAQRSAARGNAAAHHVQGAAFKPAMREALAPVHVNHHAAVSHQLARLSQQGDAAEKEAREVARTVVRNDAPAAAAVRTSEPKSGSGLVQRSAVAPSRGGTAAIPSPAGGAAMPQALRSYMEPRFGADFSAVRLHTDEAAAAASDRLNAHAFTYRDHIYFARGAYQPDSAGGRELIAHELAHTIQQGAVTQAGDAAAPGGARGRIQRAEGPRDVFARLANAIPGFRLLTILIGVNPISMQAVPATGANILTALLELIPVTGALIAQALNSYGILDRAAAWAEGQMRTLGLAAGQFSQALIRFIAGISPVDVINPFAWDGLWEQAQAIFTAPIARMLAFARSLAGGFVRLVRDAVILPLARLAEGTRGYPLLKAVLGFDPVTGEPVPRSAETLIGGFMHFIGEDEIWENIKRSNATARAWAWFQSALAGLLAFVRQVPPAFIAALQSLQIADLLQVPAAFGRVSGVFLNAVGRFGTWALGTIWTLLEIVFEAVNPKALLYIRKTGAALRSILRNPMPFASNLVRAAKQGFVNFGDNFLTHLKAGLIGWLTGALPGVYIPKAFSLPEIAKFALSVLGLSWANIRAKLVKAIGETAVKAMETGFDLVVTLVTGGPAALWEKIKEQLSNLKDMVIGAITGFITDLVVKKAIPKLISMFIPGAGFISAILSIWDSIKVFLDRLQQIIEVVTGFLDSLVAIAEGAIGAAAGRVEKILANLLSLAINFMAAFAGLGGVAEKVMGIFQKIRAPIDKALDWLVNWIVTMAKKLFAKVMGRDKETPEQKQKRLDTAASAALAAVSKYAGKPVGALVLKPILAVIKLRYGLSSIEPVKDGKFWKVRLEINPVKVIKTPALAGETGKITLRFQYETRWPLDEFVSKTEVMRKAAERKKVKEVVPPDLKTVGKGKTKELRVGGQQEFRDKIKSFINKSMHSAAAALAHEMLAGLQADHQQELQVGGQDNAANLALIESSMNASLGSQLKNALVQETVSAETIIDAVEVLKKPPDDDKEQVRKSGLARKLQDHMLEDKNHKAKLSAQDKKMIKDWFKLDR